MQAVIKSGGKQYRVVEGDILNLEKLAIEPGEAVNFDQILMVVGDNDAVQVGQPFLQGASVSATVEMHGRGPKIRGIKFKRRKHHMKQYGHRQDYTRVKIGKISLSAVN